MIGEIDCREGMLVAVDRDKYDNVTTAMKATVALFLQVVVPLIRRRQFRVSPFTYLDISNYLVSVEYQIYFFFNHIIHILVLILIMILFL